MFLVFVHFVVVFVCFSHRFIYDRSFECLNEASYHLLHLVVWVCSDIIKTQTSIFEHLFNWLTIGSEIKTSLCRNIL